MAGCYVREMDDLHRRWLPPEIFADIGIADAAPPSLVDIEGIAVHLVGLLSRGSGKEEPPRSPPPPGGFSSLHDAQVCGLEGKLLVACGCGGGAAAARSFLPHSPVRWQVPTNLVNGGGGVLDPRLAPLPSCPGSPPAKRLGGGGTGVFLPRSEVYQRAAATKSPARGAGSTGSSAPSDLSSSGVSRAMIKERFKSFNMQFEELHAKQSQWTIPDQELREYLRLAVAEVLLPAYRSFVKRFGNLVEHGKNPNKYIRYSPEVMDQLLGEFFEGQQFGEQTR